MTSHKRIAQPDDPARALLKGIAMDIGKEVVAYVERMYAEATISTNSGFRLSLRNVIHNEIVNAIDETTGKTDTEILAWLASRKHARRKLKTIVGLIRDTDWEATKAKIAEGHSWTDAVNAVVNPTAFDEDV
jgi:hypothetical protein